ncbi:MAG: phosphodiester glycosidase family protein [bacterium]
MPFYENHEKEEDFILENNFCKIKAENYKPYYTVIKINFSFPLPYELIEISQENDKLILSLPMKYHVKNTIYFYSSDSLIASFNYNLVLTDSFLNVNGYTFYNSYQIEVPSNILLNHFKIKFASNSKKEDLGFTSDYFWFAVNGTYFAKTGNSYNTVAGVMEEDKVLFYPVKHRPARGFFAVLEKDGVKKLIFDRLPPLEFLSFIEGLKKEGRINFLLQAGPLIYRDSQFVMDVDAEALGEKGNNIIPPAPRTVIYTDNYGNFKTEVIYGIEGKRKEGFNIYELAYYLENSQNALNLDGGSSSIMYICNKKIEPIFAKSLPYKSQNYIVFYSDFNYITKGEKYFYYYFPGIFGFGKSIKDQTFGSKYVTIFDGFQKYQKVKFNDNLNYYFDESGKMVFLQTNDLELSVSKLEEIFKKVEVVSKYYNCYILKVF